ncbi:MAG: hypothetical protein WCH76_06455 [Candidatus Riflemargulisbacteria bacterium]
MRINDPNSTGNVLQGAISGQIINSADLQQIGINNTAFNILLGELDRIERQADKLCLTPEVITGDRMPSNIPFRSLAGQMNSAKSAFAYIKQSIGEEIGFLLEEKLFPSIVKNWNRGDMIDIMDDLKDINIYDEQMIIQKEIEYITTANEQGKVVSDEELKQVEEEYRANLQKTGRTIEIPKKFFNFEFGISVDVTGESVDKSQQNDAYSNILQWKMQNPQIVNDPFFRQYCENNGVTPFRMTQKEIAQQQMGAQQQGAQPVKPGEQANPQALASAINS